MNLRQHENSTEAKTKGLAWYQQPETTQAVPAVLSAQTVQPSPVSEQEPRQLPPEQQALYDPSAAERILAQAGALQEVHGQLLSREQIEAVAAEIGITPEFVHLAIEQEKNGIAAQSLTVVQPQTRSLTKLRVVTTGIACALFAAVYAGLNIQSAHEEISITVVILAACVFPLLLSLLAGAVGQSRRWGAVSGLAIALTAITFCLFPDWHTTIDSFTLGIFAGAIVSSTLFGVVRAQVRRVVSKRRAKRRNQRSLFHESV